MMDKIKPVLDLAAIALAMIAAWYACSLRAEVDALEQALTRSQAVIEEMQTNLDNMRAASQIVTAKQESAAQKAAAMNREIKSIKENAGHEENSDMLVNAVLADQLNRLFR